MTIAAIKQKRIDLDLKEGWATLVFLALALIVVTWSMSEAGYDEGLNSLMFVTLGAIAAGLFLAKSHFPGPIAHLFGLVYGITWNAFVISSQLPPTFTARDKLLEVGYRLGLWIQKTVLGGELGTDPLMFTVVMSALFWLMVYLAMWFSFRDHNVWVALLPSGITMLLNLYYGPERLGFLLVPYLLFILLFVARLNLYINQDGWRRHRIRYDTGLAYTFVRYTAVLSVLTITLAWIVPTAASSEQAEVFFSRFTEPWERVKEEWIRLFSTLQSERPQASYAAFGTSLALGGPVNLGNATLMDVRASTGRYWRAAIYDRYTGSGWTSSNTETRFLGAGDPLGETIPYEARRVVTQTFTLYMPGTSQLYALEQPERFSLPVKADLVEAQGDDRSPIVESLAMASSRYTLKSGDSYMVISTVASVDEDAMRQAGEEYPDWIDRYLQLPDDLPQRVRDLAQEITAQYDNPYDRATALQDYLRKFTYNDKILAPPADVDRVDYFLFEMKEGYCNYFASAMAVMARSVGIPARLAAGSGRGDWEEDIKAYRVREYHSHAWVEVYLPRFGWIDFEPTANEPAIVRPRAARAGENAQGGNGDAEHWEDYLNEQLRSSGGGLLDERLIEQILVEQRRRQRVRTWTRVGGVLAVSALIIVVAWWMGRRKESGLQPASLYYERMVSQANWWGCKMRPFDTPNEYAVQLATSLGDAESARLIHRIADAYVGERYGNKNAARYQPDFAWRDLRSPLTRWGIGQIWHRLRRRGRTG
jgi:transglutaminase-like putative cysteine protease